MFRLQFVVWLLLATSSLALNLTNDGNEYSSSDDPSTSTSKYVPANADSFRASQGKQNEEDSVTEEDKSDPTESTEKYTPANADAFHAHGKNNNEDRPERQRPADRAGGGKTGPASDRPEHQRPADRAGGGKTGPTPQATSPASGKGDQGGTHGGGAAIFDDPYPGEEDESLEGGVKDEDAVALVSKTEAAPAGGQHANGQKGQNAGAADSKTNQAASSAGSARDKPDRGPQQGDVGNAQGPSAQGPSAQGPSAGSDGSTAKHVAPESDDAASENTVGQEEDNSYSDYPWEHWSFYDLSKPAVDDGFSDTGKFYVAALYVIVWVFVIIIPKRPAIAVVGSVIMFLLRHQLQAWGHAPSFDLMQYMKWDALLFLLASLLIGASLSGVYSRLTYMDHPVSAMVLTMGASSLWIQDSFVKNFLELSPTVSSPPFFLAALTFSAAIGSSLAMTGSMSNILVVLLAADDMSWLDFTSNMLLPVICSYAILVTVFCKAQCFSASGMKGYSGLSQDGDEDEDDAWQVPSSMMAPVPQKDTDEEKKSSEDVDVEKTITHSMGGLDVEGDAEEDGVRDPTCFRLSTLALAVAAALIYFGFVLPALVTFAASLLLALLPMSQLWSNGGLCTKIFICLAALFFNNYVVLFNWTESLAKVVLGVFLVFVLLLGFMNSVQTCIVLGMTILYACGYNTSMVTLCAGLLLMICENRRRRCVRAKIAASELDDDSTDGCDKRSEIQEEVSPNDVLVDLDCSPVFFYAALFILVGSLIDTGLPELFFKYALDDCVDELASPECLLLMMETVGFLSVVASPVPTILMFAAVFPSAESYVWMQVAWVASMAGSLSLLKNSVVEKANELGYHNSWTHWVCFRIPVTLGCLVVGVILISLVHF